MTVLVLTRHTMDATADMVITELTARGVSLVRLDPADFPGTLTISARLDPGQDRWQGVWRGEHRDLDLSTVRAVYYRRPGRFQFDPRMNQDALRWADSEARAAVGGVLSSLRCTWINHPWRNAWAAVAPYALAQAARCGLTIPATLITSDPQEAREFISALPGAVAAYKAIGPTHPGVHDGRRLALWTSKVRPQEITDAVSLTAHQFQQWIDKAYEVRATCVGRRTFAAEIHAGSDASRIDFRRDYDSLTYRECTVPGTVVAGLHRLMDTFGLRYLACDFLVNQNNDWFLVDINPGGQYGFIPDLRDPITHAIADELEGKTTA
ncbi:ATP-grasp ribosomal peptide maturase [Streptomyces aidingensis]|uniref:ATP-grasp ribosomal peptide maturase, SAV_5884 family n=1 Tax=Streptomyces aidingensis TaxID=910347 RepID=A0A1I1J8D3_9ACTN|nr:ATP-grasp ribosomal peptide maturase [Streptomyces aidingensis]SFC44814.1 ATP-grasp ribosomal peptide maturase, SAV_5884 family [Streptomyces aidingensis]